VKSRDEERIAKLLDGFVQELQAMPDAEVLAGEPATAVRARAADRLARATQEAGRRRMAAARIQSVHVRKESAQPVSLAEARNYIARIAQDGNYTLAARQLEEMPESEILRLYEQLRELEDEDPSST
jgi:uncharacterized protein with von Willebrand factor type A (vWA) domain